MMIYTIAIFEVIYGAGNTEIVTHAGINPDYPATDYAYAHEIIVREKYPGATVKLVACLARSYPSGPWVKVI